MAVGFVEQRKYSECKERLACKISKTDQLTGVPNKIPFHQVFWLLHVK